MVSVSFSFGRRASPIDPVAKDREERIQRQARLEAMVTNLKNTGIQADDELTSLLAGIAKERDAEGNFVWGSLEEVRERNPQLAQLIDRGAATVARSRSRLAELTGTPELGERALDAFERYRQVFNAARSGEVGTARAAQAEAGAETISSAVDIANNFFDQVEAGGDPARMAQALDLIAQTNPQAQALVNALKIMLPQDASEASVRQAQNKVAAARQQAPVFEAAGVDPATSMIMAMGNVASVQLPSPAGQLTGPERAQLRGEVIDLGQTNQTLDSVLNDIDDDVVGLWGAISENVGGIGQQIQGVKQVMNLLPGLGLDEATVNRAIVARNNFRFAIGQLSRLITEKGGRLSNEDREFVKQASGLLDTRTTPAAARETVQRLKSIVENTISTSGNLLRLGEVPLEPGGGGGGFRPTAPGSNVFINEETGETIDLGAPMETEAAPEATTPIEPAPLTPEDQSLVPQANPPIPGPGAAAGESPIGPEELDRDLNELVTLKRQIGPGQQFNQALDQVLSKYRGDGRALETIARFLGGS